MKPLNTPVNQINSSQLATTVATIDQDQYLLGELNEWGFTSRNIFRWGQDGYLLKPQSKAQKWGKYSFVDYIWIKILLCMSDLGVSKKSISEGAGQKEGNANKIINCLATLNLHSKISSLISPRSYADDDQQDAKRAAYQPIKDKAYQALTQIIADSILTRAEYQIRIYREGVCQLWRNEVQIASSISDQHVDSQSFVQIAFWDFFGDFITMRIKTGDGKDLMWKGFLTNPEGSMVEHLRHPGLVSKLTVVIDGEEPVNLPVTKEVTDERGVTEGVAQYLTKRIIKGDYHKMIYEFAGSPRSFVKGSDDTEY
jgi:DNA-binding transcriptional MerR regulator